MSSHLILRADASSRIGTGHVMRCLALGQAWISLGGTATLVTLDLPAALRKQAIDHKTAVQPAIGVPGSREDAEHTMARSRKLGRAKEAWVVCDGYHFGVAFQDAIRGAGFRLLLVDDYGSIDGYHADIVLNQNLGADDAWYRSALAETRCLLGPRYALLRPEFLGVRNKGRLVRRAAQRILITLGGADPHNASCRCLEAITGAGDDGRSWHVRVIVGAANRHGTSLRSVVGSAAGRHRVELVQSTTRMAEEMAWADLVVSAAGSTVWELACVGTPFFTTVLAENQVRIAEAIERRFPGSAWGDAQQIDPGRVRADLVRLADDWRQRTDRTIALRSLVDGRGAARVVAAMRGFEKEK